MVMSRFGWWCLMGVLMATSCSKGEKVISSVCVDEATAANSIASIVALQATLPKGASVESRDNAMVVSYQQRQYSVSLRKDGGRACFDFTPPIPQGQ